MFTWELGGAQGHVFRQLPIAEALRDRGWTVIFAVRELAAVRPIHERGFRTVIAPRLQEPRTARLQAVNYAEILMRAGLIEPGPIETLLRSWLDLYDLLGVDIICADFAPSSQIAARIAGIKQTATGDGFAFPPPTFPSPTIRPWLKIPQQRFQESDRRVLTLVNQVSKKMGGPMLETIGALVAGQPGFLNTFEELDHYERTADQLTKTPYIGPVFNSPPGNDIVWPEDGPKGDGGPKVFAYLNGRAPPFKDYVKAVHAEAGSAVVVGRGLDEATAQQLSSPGLTVTSQNLSLSSVFEACDVVVCHGGMGTLSQTLMAGVVPVVIPQHPEQGINGFRLKAQSLGETLGANDKPSLLPSLIQRALGGVHQDNVSAFAAKYAHYDVTATVQKIADKTAAQVS